MKILEETDNFIVVYFEQREWFFEKENIITKLINIKKQKVILDMTDIFILNSLMITILLKVREFFDKNNIDFVLRNVEKKIIKLFELMMISYFFKIEE